MRKIGIFAVSILLLVGACKMSYKPLLVNVDNQFSLTVMDYLKKVDNLKEGAPFQYSNKFRNFYAVAFYGENQLPVDSFYNQELSVLKNVLKLPKVSQKEEVEISGLKGIKTELYGEMQGENVYYSHLLLRDGAKYYEICVWTRGEERKLRYREDIEAILQSFKLIKK